MSQQWANVALQGRAWHLIFASETEKREDLTHLTVGVSADAQHC